MGPGTSDSHVGMREAGLGTSRIQCGRGEGGAWHLRLQCGRDGGGARHLWLPLSMKPPLPTSPVMDCPHGSPLRPQLHGKNRGEDHARPHLHRQNLRTRRWEAEIQGRGRDPSLSLSGLRGWPVTLGVLGLWLSPQSLSSHGFSLWVCVCIQMSSLG